MSSLHDQPGIFTGDAPITLEVADGNIPAAYETVLQIEANMGGRFDQMKRRFAERGQIALRDINMVRGAAGIDLREVYIPRIGNEAKRIALDLEHEYAALKIAVVQQYQALDGEQQVANITVDTEVEAKLVDEVLGNAKSQKQDAQTKFLSVAAMVLGLDNQIGDQINVVLHNGEEATAHAALMLEHLDTEISTAGGALAAVLTEVQDLPNDVAEQLQILVGSINGHTDTLATRTNDEIARIGNMANEILIQVVDTNLPEAIRVQLEDLAAHANAAITEMATQANLELASTGETFRSAVANNTAELTAAATKEVHNIGKTVTASIDGLARAAAETVGSAGATLTEAGAEVITNTSPTINSQIENFGHEAGGAVQSLTHTLQAVLRVLGAGGTLGIQDLREAGVAQIHANGATLQQELQLTGQQARLHMNQLATQTGEVPAALTNTLERVGAAAGAIERLANTFNRIAEGVRQVVGYFGPAIVGGAITALALGGGMSTFGVTTGLFLTLEYLRRNGYLRLPMLNQNLNFAF